MPVVRLEVRNEYGLGDPELYKGAVKKDPKALLDGVAVAGLVGILRQLGDVAEFAADIFHDLHEQVTVTAVRGRKVMRRIQNIEAALPLVEKAIKGQKTHIHFSYVAGSDWHVKIQDERNHLLSSELPRFMMDSYEECRDPPRLYLLDKFDIAGTGSCLKRYSDPSYFKRVWAASELGKNENGPRERKKIKRKGSQLKSHEVLNTVYMPRRDARTRFTSLSMDEQSFSTENISVADMRFNPELSSRSTSFGSRTKEGYGEQTLDENPDVFTGGIEFKKLPNSILNCKDSGFSASFHPDESSIDDLDDASQHHSVQEHSVPRSSSVTWDNETEVIKASIPVSCEDILVDKVQDSEPLQAQSGPQIIDLVKTEIDLSTQEEIVGGIKKVPVFSSVMSHFEEFNSETDNYMDALNTMESETETETECQTKCEMKSPTSLNSQGVASETVKRQGAVMQHPDSAEVKVPNMPNSSLSEDLSEKFSNFSVSDNSIHSESILATDFVHHEKTTVVNYSSESTNHTLKERKMGEDPCSELHASNLHVIMNDGVTPIISTLKTSSDTPCMPSVHLWTNGGLFGVEPSKPPDLGALNISKQNVAPFLNSASDFSNYSGKNQLLNNGNAKSEILDRETEAISKNTNFAEKANGKCATSDSSGHGDSNYDPSKGSYYEDYSDDMYAKQERQVSLQRPLSVSNFSKTRDDFSVGLSDLAQRFLANTLQRKLSLGNGNTSGHYGMTIDSVRKRDESSQPNNHLECGITSLTSRELDTKEKVTHEPLKKSTSFSSHYSEQSSPPLEHMKISFLPMNGSEMCKLKLDFSTGSFRESKEDFIFPSIHLRQDHVDTLADNISDSDDDTFCRSCPYSSDDLLSPRSFTNSDMWEPDEINDCMDHGQCDASHGVSSITSISGYEQKNHATVDASTGQITGVLEDGRIPFQSESFADLPGLDSLISSGNKQGRSVSSDGPKNSEVLSNQPAPPNPPLPPVQWRTRKTSVMSEDNYADFDNHFGTLQTLRLASPVQQGQQSQKKSSVIEQDRHELNDQKASHSVTDKEVSLMEELLHQIKNKHQQLDQYKLNGQDNTKICTTNNKEPDEREELLHQIRNKSFNLRRTTALSASNLQRSSTNVANVSVSAILEKATAIRQACVGSDEGGDDNWSDG